MPGRIFINYRKADSVKDAYLIAARLKDRYGERNVFIDENLKGGEVFPHILEKRLSQCSVMLAVIGSRWVEVSGNDGARRLNSQEDWVRLEIRRALERKIALIPVLVNGASVPRKTDLPADICDLVDRHAVAIRTEDQGFRGDMAVLFEAIDSTRRISISALQATIAAVILVAGSIGGYQLAAQSWSPSTSQFNLQVSPPQEPRSSSEVAAGEKSEKDNIGQVAGATSGGNVGISNTTVSAAELKKQADDTETKRLLELAAKLKLDQEVKGRAIAVEQARAAAEMERKRQADAVEQQKQEDTAAREKLKQDAKVKDETLARAMDAVAAELDQKYQSDLVVQQRSADLAAKKKMDKEAEDKAVAEERATAAAAAAVELKRQADAAESQRLADLALTTQQNEQRLAALAPQPDATPKAPKLPPPIQLDGQWTFSTTSANEFCLVKSGTKTLVIRGRSVSGDGITSGSVDAAGNVHLTFPAASGSGKIVDLYGRLSGSTGHGTYRVLDGKCTGRVAMRRP